MLADKMLDTFGEHRAPLALAVASLLYAFPIFLGAALLTMERTSFANDGRVVEFGHHLYRASRYSFSVTLVDS